MSNLLTTPEQELKALRDMADKQKVTVNSMKYKTESDIMPLPDVVTKKTSSEVSDLQTQLDELRAEHNTTVSQLASLQKSHDSIRGEGSMFVDHTPSGNIVLSTMKKKKEWDTSYSGLDANGLFTTLTVAKGYFGYGAYRGIASSDYTIAAPSVAGSYIIVARLNAGDSWLPTCFAVTETLYKQTQDHYGFDGLSGRLPIARATVAVSSGVYYWTDLVQAMNGELWQDRYDGEANIEFIDGNHIAIQDVDVYYHSSGYQDQKKCSNNTPLVIAQGSGPGFTNYVENWITAYVPFDFSTRTIYVSPTKPVDTDGVGPGNGYKFCLWAIRATVDEMWVAKHSHPGVLDIWGDAKT